jgi:3-dehydro-L-gulonate 2-dehydrogenase
MLPVDGGFNSQGELTRDAAAIEASQRPLPVGYWKGSGLAVVLDMAAAVLSLGKATHQIAPDPLRETGLSQVFVAINPGAVGPEAVAPHDEREPLADAIIDALHKCRAAEEGKPVRYPGEQTMRIRAENRRLGLPVDPAVWAEIEAM